MMKAIRFSVFTTLIGIGALILTISTVVIVVGNSLPAMFSYAQTTNIKTTTNATTFHSAFDTFAVPGSVKGYGAYQAHNSSIFKPAENILLYVEPAGYSYKPVGSLFLMNFTADIVISNKTSGHVLAEFQNVPISTLISHHKNKELFMIITVNQSTPFPPGNYMLKYTIHDVPSGNSFDIVKNIMIGTG